MKVNPLYSLIVLALMIVVSIIDFNFFLRAGTAALAFAAAAIIVLLVAAAFSKEEN